MRALIVERSRVFRHKLGALLEESGVATQSCDGIEAAAALCARCSFAFVTSGMHLEDGTALDLAVRLRTAFPDRAMPIYVLTGDDRTGQRELWNQAGITEVFSKDHFEHFVRQIRLRVAASQEPDEPGEILYVEDSRAEAGVTVALLERHGFALTHCTDGESAIAALAGDGTAFDLIITDMVLPGAVSGLSLVRSVRGEPEGEDGGERGRIPILAVTAFDDVTRRVELFRAGIDDYVPKPVLAEELVARVRNLVTRKRLADRVRRQRSELERMASTDVLTGCHNRRSLLEAAPRLIARARALEEPLALLVVDLDHFKQVNDRWGHAVGDAVLAETGAALRAQVRPSDVVARAGGEEFVVLLPGCGEGAARARAEAIRAAIARMGTGAPVVTASIGLTATVPGPGTSFEQLFSCADRALYEAKGAGRNRVCTCRPEDCAGPPSRAPALPEPPVLPADASPGEPATALGLCGS